jgi:site-specific DNA-methyltransferase (adenine-specific)
LKSAGLQGVELVVLGFSFFNTNLTIYFFELRLDLIMTEQIERIDTNPDLQSQILPFCRLKYGEVWHDPVSGHKVGCLDVANEEDVKKIMGNQKAVLAIQDPPYNVVVGNSNTKNLGKIELIQFIEWCKKWIENINHIMAKNASLYIWLGADQRDNYQPLPDFMVMMREFEDWQTRSLITMRNQRGYGTQLNWMAVRQELLYYIKNKPSFNIEAEYTDIPKILRTGYYKDGIGNEERSKSNFIRAGNVWVDIQQVFYRMEENVPGCYAQKPLKSTARIIEASSNKGDLVIDFFAHSGSTLIACEQLGRRCFTMDIDPIFAEISIRRLERYRKIGKTGWQWFSPFPELLPVEQREVEKEPVLF